MWWWDEISLTLVLPLRVLWYWPSLSRISCSDSSSPTFALTYQRSSSHPHPYHYIKSQQVAQPLDRLAGEAPSSTLQSTILVLLLQYVTGFENWKLLSDAESGPERRSWILRTGLTGCWNNMSRLGDSFQYTFNWQLSFHFGALQTSLHKKWWFMKLVLM